MAFRVTRSFVVGSLLLAGCGSGLKEFPVAKTTGIVLCQGQPVARAKVQFNPLKKEGSQSAVVGKPGFAFAGEDGRFELSTYGNGDGAVIGKHVVTAVQDPERPCDCTSNDFTVLMEVEIKEGQTNDFEVVIPPKVAGQKEQVDPFADPEPQMD